MCVVSSVSSGSVDVQVGTVNIRHPRGSARYTIAFFGHTVAASFEADEDWFLNVKSIITLVSYLQN